MRKLKNKDEMRSEYRRGDLGQGMRGKYLKSYKGRTNLVLLSPDVAAAFPTEKAVNDALRSLIRIAQRSTGLEKPPTRRRVPKEHTS